MYMFSPNFSQVPGLLPQARVHELRRVDLLEAGRVLRSRM